MLVRSSFGRFGWLLADFAVSFDPIKLVERREERSFAGFVNVVSIATYPYVRSRIKRTTMSKSEDSKSVRRAHAVHTSALLASRVLQIAVEGYSASATTSKCVIHVLLNAHPY